jgi:hypothetical protein
LIQQHGPANGELHTQFGCEWLVGPESDSAATYIDSLAGTGCNHHPVFGNFVTQVALDGETEFAPSFTSWSLEVHGPLTSAESQPLQSIFAPESLPSRESFDYGCISYRIVKQLYSPARKPLYTPLTGLKAGEGRHVLTEILVN